MDFIPFKILRKRFQKNLLDLLKKLKNKRKIPTEIVEIFDTSNNIGIDNNYPPKFNYEKCIRKIF